AAQVTRRGVVVLFQTRLLRNELVIGHTDGEVVEDEVNGSRVFLVAAVDWVAGDIQRPSIWKELQQGIHDVVCDINKARSRIHQEALAERRVGDRYRVT